MLTTQLYSQLEPFNHQFIMLTQQLRPHNQQLDDVVKAQQPQQSTHEHTTKHLQSQIDKMHRDRSSSPI